MDKLQKIKELSYWALQKAESEAYSEEAWNTLDAYADTVDDELWITNKDLIQQVDELVSKFLANYNIGVKDVLYWRVKSILTILAKDDEFVIMDILLER